MSAPIDPSRLDALLERLGFSPDGGDALVLVARRPAALLWANAAARARFAGHDDEGLAQALLHDRGAASAFAARLARLPGRGTYRLERLAFEGQPLTLVVACHPVEENGRALALLHLRGASTSRTAGPDARPDAAAEAPSRVLPITRVLWETDAAGRVTWIDDGARCLGAAAPRRGDDLPARLQPFAPDLAARVAAAAREGGSVGLLRFAWPVGPLDEPLGVEAGCTARRDSQGGLRGFFTVHGTAAPSGAEPDHGTAMEAAPEAPDPQPDDAAAIAPSPASPADVVPSVPEPPQAPGALTPAGNIVHFPVMRLGPVPANFVAALRPAPGPASDFTDLTAPRWSEAPPAAEPPAEEPDGLSASERDAFEHIRQVLGTRPFAPSPPPAGLPAGVPQLLDRIPAALRLDLAGTAYANAALRDRLGPDGAMALSGRTDLTELTAPDGTPLPAEVVSFDMAGTPAALTIVPDEPAAPAMPVVAAVLDLVSDGHLSLDEAGTVLALSPRAARLLGLAEDDAHGRPFATFLSEGQGPGWQALAAAATGPAAQPQGPAPLRLRAASGQPIPVQVRLARSGGALLCALALDRPTAAPANDSAEAARREAERTSALKSEFLAKVSHEIRTPLNAILGFAEVIRDERLGPVGNARYLEYLRDIHASGTHVMSLVNDLLDLSRIEAGRMDLNLEAVDANAVVQACVNTLQTQAHRERVIVRLSLTPRLPPTLADERSLRQIVLNLLSNAVKFNEPGGQVIVSTALAGPDAVAIRIRDTGIGMSEDEIAAAMEPFRQLSTVNRTGSGLGLPLTKALVEANCASMTIKSTRGEGTLVEVTFPLVEQGSVSLPAE